jgi:hypothetical protein
MTIHLKQQGVSLASAEGVLRNKISLIFGLAAAIFIALAIIGTVHKYSPVPFWDMWDSYINFYIRASAGDWGSWWAQHNEHRILLARLFFWMDLAWFDGRGWFLLAINYLLMGLVSIIFWLTWQAHSKKENLYLGFFLLAWLFSWSQHENLTWGFQSVFILAQLLPLAAFYFLHRAVSSETYPGLLFSVATLCGLLAVGSLASGVLALPLMTVYAVLVRMRWQRSLLLAILSLATIWLYFHNYHAPVRHGSLTRALLENPVDFVHYVLLYLGGPFFYLFGSRFIAVLAGAFLITSSAVFVWRILPNVRQASLSLALLTFILYIGGTAVGTAGGRLIFGVEQALSSRYMTPVLMAWAALLVLYVPSLNSLNRRMRGQLWIPFLLLLALMLPQQLKALASQQEVLFQRKIAALALELGVKDQPQIRHIYPSAATVLSSSEVPRERNLSIFGLSPIRDAREAMDKMMPIQQCQGHVDRVEAIEGVTRYLRVRGWFYDSRHHSVPESVRFVDNQGIVKGIVLTGKLRPDVAKAIDPAAELSGFEGYVLADAQGKSVELVDPQSGCRFTAQISAH